MIAGILANAQLAHPAHPGFSNVKLTASYTTGLVLTDTLQGDGVATRYAIPMGQRRLVESWNMIGAENATYSGNTFINPGDVCNLIAGGTLTPITTEVNGQQLVEYTPPSSQQEPDDNQPIPACPPGTQFNMLVDRSLAIEAFS